MCRGVSGISFPGPVVSGRAGWCQELHCGMHATGKSPDFMHFCIRVQLLPSGALTDMGSGWGLHRTFFSTMPLISPIDSLPSLVSFTAYVFHALGHKPLLPWISEQALSPPAAFIRLLDFWEQHSLKWRKPMLTPGLILVWFIKLRVQLTGYDQYPLKNNKRPFSWLWMVLNHSFVREEGVSFCVCTNLML